MIRVGLGYDIHRLVNERKMMIGGIHIPFEKGCLGHSDADALLHAIGDGILGAASLGDIGEHFPDTDKRYKNISSAIIIEKILKLIEKQGFSVVYVDSIIILEHPKLKKYKEKIKKNIAAILKIEPSCVNVKAKTKEGLESEGSGFSISAHAVVTLEKQDEGQHIKKIKERI